MESSGTSGMKAGMNGVVNLSVLDGWWDEGWSDGQRLAIGGRESSQDEAAQDWASAMDLYRLLKEGEGESTSATRKKTDRWVERMRRWIATTLWQFSTTRMLHEYTERLYLGAAGVEVAGRRPVTRRRARRRNPPARGPGGSRYRNDRRRRVRPGRRLALTLHDHQPIGNFGWVFAEVFVQAYKPMVEALGAAPTVRVGPRCTGPLLEWLRAERPAFITALQL